MTSFGAVALLIVFLVLVLAITYLRLAPTLGSSAAMRQILQTSLILVILLIVFSLVVNILPPLSFEFIYRGLILGTALLIFMGLPTLYIIHRRRAGACVLYFGRTRMHKVRLIVGAVELVSGVLLGIFSFFDAKLDLDLLYSLLLLLSQGFFLLFVGIFPIQVTEHGLLDLSLQPWENMMSYEWEQDKVNTLTLTYKRRGFSTLFKTTSHSIPPQHKSALDEILRQYVVEETSEAIPSIP